MSDQNSKKNGKVKQMGKKPLTPEEHSVSRLQRVSDAVFKSINDTANTIQKEGNGEVTVTEVTSVLLQMAFSYNGRNLEAEQQPQEPKKK